MNGKVLGGALLCALAVGAGTVRADTVALYNDFSDLSDLQLNGATASIHGGGTVIGPGGQPVLRLTNSLGQGGSAFLKNTVSLANQASFSSAFSFQITDPQGISDLDGQGADGIVFVVQTVANNVGGVGGGIGYQGIPKSVGIEFDTWDNGGQDDFSGNHVGINLNGSVNSVSLAPVAGRMNDGNVRYAWVDYDGATDTLEVRLNTVDVRPEAALLSYTVDLTAVLQSQDAYVGFTSGTGAAGGDHDIRTWELRNDFAPIDAVPLPGVASLGGAIFAAMALARRTRRHA